nr:hypothetical protein [Tanacetum cinerariifolium]
MISRRYPDSKKALITTPSTTPILIAFFFNNIAQDFQEANDEDKEEVSDDEEIIQVKVLMAFDNDELDVRKNHARNGEWIDITMRKEQLKEEKHVNEKWLNSSNKAVNECLKLTKAPTDPKSSKESRLEPLTPLPPLKVLEGGSSSSDVMPLTYQEHSLTDRPSLGTMKHTKPDT